MCDYIIGFDFGHGETSVAEVDVKAITPQSIHIEAKDIYIIGNGREPKVPSMIGYDVDGNKNINFDAYQFRFLKVGAYFKAPMVASEDFPSITEEDKEYFKDFVVTVFQNMLEHKANAHLANKKVLYFVACPSGWNKEQREAYLDFFRNYCKLPITDVVEESRAAHVVARRKLYDRNPQLSMYGKKIAVLDLGSSTLDITMHADKTYTDGYKIGASRIEETLLQFFLETDPAFKEKYEAYAGLENTCKKQILFMLRMAKEDYFNNLSNRPPSEVTLKCPVDWEELSADEIPGTSYLKIKGNVLDTMLDSKGEYKNALRDSVNDFIAKNGKVDAVVLTGGASQMPFYKDIVLDCYGLTDDQCVVDPNPSYSISQGTAIMGYLDTKNPAKDDMDMPESLRKLIESIPGLIKGEVVKCTTEAYKVQVATVVNRWRKMKGRKTLNMLYKMLSTLLASWDEQIDEINKNTNQQVAQAVSDTINNSLREMMRLYFSYDVQMNDIKLDYEFNMAMPPEQTMIMLKGIYQNFEEIMKSYGFYKFKGKESMEKDRSGSEGLVMKLADGTIDFVDKWFNGYDVDDEFDDIIKDCQDATRDFYFECIRQITCQV